MGKLEKGGIFFLVVFIHQHGHCDWNYEARPEILNALPSLFLWNNKSVGLGMNFFCA